MKPRVAPRPVRRPADKRERDAGRRPDSAVRGGGRWEGNTYEATIEDPNVFERPWKIAFPVWQRAPATEATLLAAPESTPAGPPASEISMTRIAVGDFTFDVRVAGPADGEVVLLLHGFPQSSYEWRQQQRALAEAGYRAVAPDQRGYSPGARPPAVEDYALPLLVQDVIGLADAVGAERFHVVGHDWGAIVAWAVAIAVPERVITANPVSVPHPDAFAAVLNDPSSCQVEASSYFDLFVQPDSEDGFLADDSEQLRALFAELEADAVEEYIGVVGSKAALGAALNWYRANIAARNFQDGPLGAVQVPTMFTWSDGDQALCIDGAVLTEEYVEGPYRFEILERVSHWIPEVAAEALSALLVDHIGRYAER